MAHIQLVAFERFGHAVYVWLVGIERSEHIRLVHFKVLRGTLAFKVGACPRIG